MRELSKEEFDNAIEDGSILDILQEDFGDKYDYLDKGMYEEWINGVYRRYCNCVFMRTKSDKNEDEFEGFCLALHYVDLGTFDHIRKHSYQVRDWDTFSLDLDYWVINEGERKSKPKNIKFETYKELHEYLSGAKTVA